MFRAFKTTDPDFDLEPTLDRVAYELVTGNLCIFPVDTIYGILALSSEPGARKLVQVKKRPPDKPFLLLCKSIDEALAHAAELSPGQKQILTDYWPGSISFILPSRSPLAYCSPPVHTIGIRVPKPETMIGKLLSRLPTGFGVWAPSANFSEEPYNPDPAPFVEACRAQFSKLVTTVVTDPDLAPDQPPSTIVDLVGDDPRVLRPGAVNFVAPE